jgi:hypothetical protein
LPDSDLSVAAQCDLTVSSHSEYGRHDLKLTSCAAPAV